MNDLFDGGTVAQQCQCPIQLKHLSASRESNGPPPNISNMNAVLEVHLQEVSFRERDVTQGCSGEGRRGRYFEHSRTTSFRNAFK